MDFFDILLASKLNRSGGGAVNSVNGQTGTVELTAEDVGALSNETLKPAVDLALAQAKASGEFDGADGLTPTIGENGNWYLGDTDTGKPSRGDKGDKGDKGDTGETGATGATGAAGAAGKSAYQYAQDGGYTGTEEDFAAKLAKEKLPNPYALTFTGAVDKVYDGSQEITIEIPSGGSEDDWNIIADETLTEDVIEVVYNGLSLRKILICIYAIGSAANTTNGNSAISINGNRIFYSPNITVVGDTTKRWAQFFADCIKDTIRFYASTNNNNTYQSNQIMTGWFDGVSKIETVKIHSGGLTRMIGAGTRIRILGVTAS